MRKAFGGPYSGLFAKLPTICAELREPVGFVRKGSRVYLCEKPDTENEFVTVLGLTGMNYMELLVLKWDQLRYAELRSVPAGIAERCWRGTKEETLAALTAVKEKLKTDAHAGDPFAPNIDI